MDNQASFFQRMLFVCSLSLVVIFSIGLLMVFGTSSAEFVDNMKLSLVYIALLKQILFFVIGFVLALCAYFWGFESLYKAHLKCLIVCTVLLLATFIPGIGQVRNGAHRWIGVANWTIQPSEFAKFILPLFFLARLNIYKLDQNWSLKNLSIAMWPLLPAMILILISPDNRTTFLLLTTYFVVLLLKGIRWRHWLLPLLAFISITVGVASQLNYVQKRIQVFLHPDLDPLGRGHQPMQSKIAIGSGGLTGRGIGQSMQKYSYLPEAQNDYIAAIFCEETGFLGVLLLCIGYGIWGASAMAIAMMSKSENGKIFGGVIVHLILFQAFVNLGVVCGILPSTGLNLPFFSQGGSSLVANMIAVGFLFSLGKTKHEKK